MVSVLYRVKYLEDSEWLTFENANRCPDVGDAVYARHAASGVWCRANILTTDVNNVSIDNRALAFVRHLHGMKFMYVVAKCILYRMCRKTASQCSSKMLAMLTRVCYCPSSPLLPTPPTRHRSLTAEE